MKLVAHNININVLALLSAVPLSAAILSVVVVLIAVKVVIMLCYGYHMPKQQREIVIWLYILSAIGSILFFISFYLKD